MSIEFEIDPFPSWCISYTSGFPVNGKSLVHVGLGYFQWFIWIKIGHVRKAPDTQRYGFWWNGRHLHLYWNKWEYIQGKIR